MNQKIYGASGFNHAFNQARLQLGGMAATAGAKLAEVNDKLDLKSMPTFQNWSKETLPDLHKNLQDKLATASQDPANRLTPAMAKQIEKSVLNLAEAAYNTHTDVLRNNESPIRARLHEAFPVGVADKALRIYSGIRNDGQNVLDRMRGKEPTDSYKNADPRGKIFAQMCDTSNPTSALNKTVAHNVQTVMEAGLSKALSDVKQGQLPNLTTALISDELRGHAPDKDLRSVLDARLCMDNCPSLRKEATLSHFSASIIDNYMQPHPEVCRDHANVLHASVLDLRGKLQKLADAQGPDKPANADFSRKVETLFVDAASKVNKEVGSRHLGLDRNQASLVGMGLQTWIADVIQTPYNAGSATSLLAFVGSALPAGVAGADARTGLGIARGLVGFAVGAASQAVAGQAVTHSASNMRGLPAGLIGGNFNAMDKIVTKATRQAIEGIQAKMTGAPLEAAFAANVSKAQARIETTSRWFGPSNDAAAQKAAQAFVRDTAMPVHDALCALKDTLTQRVANKAAPMAPQDKATAESALKLLSGFQSSRGLAPAGPHDALAQVMALVEKTGVSTAGGADAAVTSALKSLSAHLDPKDTYTLRKQVANPLPRPPVQDNVLDPQAMVRSVNHESPAFQKLMKDLGTQFGTAGKQDAFNGAVSTLIHTDLVVGIVASALTSLVSGAVGAAAGGPLGAAGGAAAGAAVGSALGSALNKGVRAITGVTTDLAMSAAATRNRVADASLSPRRQVTPEVIAQTLEKGWTKFSAIRDSNLDKVVSHMSHDVQTKIAEESARMGRNLMGSVFQATGNLAGSELLANYDKANAQYNHAEYKKAATAPDKERVAVAKSRIGQVADLAGLPPAEREAATAKVDTLGPVKRMAQRAEKAETRSSAASEKLPGLYKDLMKEFIGSIDQLKDFKAISPKEWNAMRSFLQYPGGHPEVRDEVAKMGSALKDFWAANGSPSATADITHSVIHQMPKPQGFQQAQARHENNITRAASDANVLGKDVEKFRKGQYEAVQDPFGLFKRMNKGYESEMRQLKVADVNSGYLEERVAGAVYGRGGVGMRLAGVAVGVAPMPAATAMPMGALPKVSVTAPFQGMAQAFTTNALAPFVESADWMGRNPGGKSRWLDTVKDVVSPYVDPAAQNNVNMAATSKVRSASKNGVLSHDVLPLRGQVVGFPTSMTSQVIKEEASHPVLQRTKNMLNVPKHILQSLDNAKATAVKSARELSKSMASIDKIQGAAIGEVPVSEKQLSPPQLSTFNLRDAVRKA